MRRAVLLSLSLFVLFFLSIPANAQRGGHTGGGGGFHSGGGGFRSGVGGFRGGAVAGRSFSSGGLRSQGFVGGRGSIAGRGFSGRGFRGRGFDGHGGRGRNHFGGGWGGYYPYWGWGWPYWGYSYYPYYDYGYYSPYYGDDYDNSDNYDPNTEYYDPNEVNDTPSEYQPDPNYPPASGNNPYPQQYQYRPAPQHQQYRPDPSSLRVHRNVPQPPAGTTPRSSAVPPHAQTVIVYRDGRTQQITNYAVMDRTLYLFGEPVQKVPMDSLDLDATRKANAQHGVDFQLSPL